MATIPHGALGDRSGEVLRRAPAGETFEVTRHCEVAELIVPARGTVLGRGCQSVAGELVVVSSAIRASTRRRISSRIGRTASMPWPAGSSRTQSS